MKTLQIGSRAVGEGCPVFVIAELSANHGARKDLALKTVAAAAAAGADAIKLQTYTPDTLTLRSDAEPFVVRTKNEWAGRTLHDLYAEAMTPWEWHAELKAAAEAHGLVFFSTPFDVSAVEYLEQLGAVVHKIASFELTDLPLVEHVARRGRPMILSTGMASLGEIEAAVATCRAVGNDQLALLRCVSAYPARPESMGLASLVTLASFGTVVGLSDHTREATAAVAAVALGAKIVEKHFILDRSIGGPDAFFSLDPEEFTLMVRSVRDAERAIGAPRFGPSPEEVPSLRFRRSLFLAKDVERGTVLTCEHVRSVRPADGLPARHLPTVLGRVCTQNLAFGTPLAWTHLAAPEAVRVALRPAATTDGDFLLRLRNDDLTRTMSTSNVAVTADEHAAWLASSLQSDTRSLWIAEHAGEAVGQLRLDTSGAVAQVSLALIATARGQGLAVDLLRAGETEARARGVRVLTASIRAQNDASVASFKRAGYYAFVERTLEDGAYWLCERSLA